MAERDDGRPTKEVGKWVPASEELPEDVFWIAEGEAPTHVIAILVIPPCRVKGAGWNVCVCVYIMYIKQAPSFLWDGCRSQVS